MTTFKPIMLEDGEKRENSAVNDEKEELKSEEICTVPVNIKSDLIHLNKNDIFTVIHA